MIPSETIRTDFALVGMVSAAGSPQPSQLPCKETCWLVLFSSLAGEMPQAEGGSPSPGLASRCARTPPLSLRDISPRKGGEGNREFCRGLCKGKQDVEPAKRSAIGGEIRRGPAGSRLCRA